MERGEKNKQAKQRRMKSTEIIERRRTFSFRAESITIEF